jgi:multisubunit Na+/H+ antiporter MnhB subunit
MVGKQPGMVGLLGLVVIADSLAAGLLYERARGWKGLPMSITIAFVYAAAALGGLINLSSVGVGDFGALVAAAGVVVGAMLVGCISSS